MIYIGQLSLSQIKHGQISVNICVNAGVISDAADIARQAAVKLKHAIRPSPMILICIIRGEMRSCCDIHYDKRCLAPIVAIFVEIPGQLIAETTSIRCGALFAHCGIHGARRLWSNSDRFRLALGELRRESFSICSNSTLYNQFSCHVTCSRYLTYHLVLLQVSVNHLSLLYGRRHRHHHAVVDIHRVSS
jgi:hypothetical protein